MRSPRVGLLAVAAIVMGAPLHAQESQTVGAFELRPAVGAFIPTGSMRRDFQDAMLVGAQGGFEFSPNLHLLLGGFWSRNTTQFSSLPSRTADIWQLDAGAEVNLIMPMGRAWFVRPFAGGGAGLRMYDYRSFATNTCGAVYGAAGTEFQRFTGAIRLEARDYVTCFESPISGVRVTRNDVGLTAGFVYHVM